MVAFMKKLYGVRIEFVQFGIERKMEEKTIIKSQASYLKLNVLLLFFNYKI